MASRLDPRPGFYLSRSRRKKRCCLNHRRIIKKIRTLMELLYTLFTQFKKLSYFKAFDLTLRLWDQMSPCLLCWCKHSFLIKWWWFYTFLETWNIGNHLIHSNSYSIYRLLSTMRSSEEQVTTNLPAILYIGTSLVEGTRGRFSVDKAILTWFSTFHFILLFVISALVIIHLLFLNEKDQTIFQEFHLTKFHFTPIIQSKIF